MLFFLLLFLTLLPLANFSFFAFPFEFSKFVVFLFFSGFLTIFLGRYLIKQKSYPLPSRNISLGLLLFLGFYFISSLFSISPLTSFMGYFGFFTGGLIYTLLLLLIFYLAFILNKEKALILQTGFFSGTIVSFYGLGQYLLQFQKSHEVIFRIYSTIGQPNRLAFFLLAILPLGFFLLLSEKKHFLKILYGIFLLLNFLTFLLTFSRTSFIVLIITFFFIFCYLFRSKITIPKSLLIFFFAGIAVFGIIFAQSAFSTFKNFNTSSLSLRLAEWQGSTKAILNRDTFRQLIGFGPETSYFVFFKYRPTTYNQSQEETVVGPGEIRNQYLNYLSGIGILGLAAYLFLIISILRVSYKNCSSNLLDGGIFFSQLGIMLMSFLYYQTDVVLLIFWALNGLAVGSLTDNTEVKTSRVLKKIAGVAVMGVGVLLFYSVFRLAMAHYYASSLPTEINFQNAVKYNPLFNVYQRNLSKLYMYEMLDLRDRDNKLALNKFILSKNTAEEALQLVAVDVRNIRQLLLIKYYGGIYFDKKDQYENVEIGKKLVQLSPTDPLSWDLLGLVYLDIGKLPEAKTAFEKERELKPEFSGVYLHLGEVAKQLGKLNEAVNLYQKALQFSPSSEMAKQELRKVQKLMFQE